MILVGEFYSILNRKADLSNCSSKSVLDALKCNFHVHTCINQNTDDLVTTSRVEGVTEEKPIITLSPKNEIRSLECLHNESVN